jgi:hypothetical protein
VNIFITENCILNIELIKNYIIVVVPKDIYAYYISLTIVLYVLEKSDGSDLSTLTHSLTRSLMELSPSWEAVNCAGTQELPRILWNP